MGGGGVSVFNGAFGVDGQDILNAPDIDFGTFQLFPDSVNYDPKAKATDLQPPSRKFGKTLNDTVDWINAQVKSAKVWVVYSFLTADASEPQICHFIASESRS